MILIMRRQVKTSVKLTRFSVLKTLATFECMMKIRWLVG